MTDRRPHRLEKNAPGDWYTTGECMACGAPELEAPDLFSPLTDDDLETYFVRQPTSPDEVERTCRAAEVCCVSAIRYGGRDPAIIRRLGNSGEHCDFIVSVDREVLERAPQRRGWQFWRPRAG